MKIRKQIITTILFVVYLLTVLFTDISLTGFWTDVIFSLLLSIYALRLVFKDKTGKPWLTWTLRIANATCSIVVFGLLGLNLINPFAWDTLKLRSFYYQSVDGRLFNAYFKPGGVYSSDGYGNFWITETPKLFPIIEWNVHWSRSVHHDFLADALDGEPIDNSEVVRSYIKDKVIDKNK